MCGISVCIDFDSSLANHSLNLVKKMNTLAFHRGPDAEGIIQEKNVTLGHRRLAIIDLDSNANQPMSLDDRFYLVFNGEIYNFVELRQKLKELGHHFKTNSDTEVLLNGYAHFGKDLFTMLNGVWALVIYDKLLNKLIASRDRFGEKPLYYLILNNRILIASEIKQLVPFLDKVNANLEVVFNYVYTRQENYSEDTFFKQIKSFLPSYYYTLDISKKTFSFKNTRYYSLSESIEGKEEISKESFFDTFQQSINLRLRSDVSKGILLSGGLDSSLIAAETSKQILNNESINYFHCRSFEMENDESKNAKYVSNHFSNYLIVETPSSDKLIEQTDAVTYTQDEPYGGPSIHMGFNVFKRVSNSTDVKVILSGQGADEILLGYERYISSFINPLSLISLSRINNFSKKTSISFINLFLYSLYFRNFLFRKLILNNRSCLKKDLINNHDNSLLLKTVNSYSDLLKLQINEICSLQLPHLLRYEDRNSMAHSIESRFPFLDHNLVEKALLLNLDSKIYDGWTKYILRERLQTIGLKKIAWQRKKLGFESPQNFWFLEKYREFFSILDSSQLINELCSKSAIQKLIQKKDIDQIWPYLSLARWEKVFRVT